MPCVKSHYMNPKNVFTPKPLNPSPMREVRVMAQSDTQDHALP